MKNTHTISFSVTVPAGIHCETVKGNVCLCPTCIRRANDYYCPLFEQILSEDADGPLRFVRCRQIAG